MARICIVFILSLFPVFSHAQTGSDYYPLSVGNRWVYNNTYTGDVDPPSKTFIETVIDTDTIVNRECFMVRSQNPKGDSGATRWFEVTISGAVQEVAFGAHNGLVLAEWDPPHITLPHNASRLGATWYIQYVLHSDLHPDSTIVKTETYSIESVAETVTVPAGTFERCIKVKGELPEMGERPASVIYRYYALDVGQVLLQRESPDGSVRCELTEYKVYGR